ncbi:substrate-binding periplasmic protein [Iodobacter fluviatilis]|uniref:Amino acid ABC transporter substrate-binding protein (PAAT family) n=1 Tax=Iodobacter fluviatilis TaxID=537 RepID=A0A377Q9W3_9NEIS|nr:transporter substrate-binding domain-containing protein [Iodobacter fluviatilis]TCU82402.1 amino acid ABC transporter substrate-binding protein (PAAT family) [Iodobacter fluviatilis]STQ91627.1 Bacterial extracellular solute-binding proteins, family 3 [Iodobacter fluviatilis]
MKRPAFYPFPAIHLLRQAIALLAFCCASTLTHALTIYTENWPPVNYMAGNKVAGMAVEIVQALQNRLGNKDPIQLVPWVRGYKALLEGPNVMLFSLGRSSEREQLMVMLGPIAISSTCVYTRKGNTERLLALGDSIYNQAIGTYRGSIFVDTAAKKGFTRIDLAATPQMTAAKLMGKRFDLWIDGSVAVSSILKEIGHSADEVEKVMTLDSLELYLAFSTQTPARTIKEWEEALSWLKKEGHFQKIHRKWLPNEVPPPEVNVLRPQQDRPTSSP